MCVSLTQWEADLITHSQQLTEVHLVLSGRETQLVHSERERQAPSE